MAGIPPALQLSQKIPKTPEEIAAAKKQFEDDKAAAELARAANRKRLEDLPRLDGPVRVVKTGTTGTSLRGGLKTRRFKKKRLMSRKYCKKTPCRRMGFTQKASCRPYKNCYTRRK